MAVKIFVDQGHNPYGVNAGAEAFGVREQDITYLVGAYLVDILNADPRFDAIASRRHPMRFWAMTTIPVCASVWIWQIRGARIILSAFTQMPIQIRRSMAPNAMSIRKTIRHFILPKIS